MVVNANLTVSNDQISDFKSRDTSNSQIGDTQTSKSRKLRKCSFVRFGQIVNFTFWAQNLFFSKSESCTILVNRFRIDLSIYIFNFRIFEKSCDHPTKRYYRIPTRYSFPYQVNFSLQCPKPQQAPNYNRFLIVGCPHDFSKI